MEHLLTLAYMNEMTAALDHLSGAGIKAALRDSKPWAELRTVYQRWRRQARGVLRNEVMFHLGAKRKIQGTSNQEWTTTAQVRKWKEAGGHVPLLEQDQAQSPWMASFTGGENLIMQASGLTIPQGADDD